jgi:hypothetical protein
VRNLFEVERFVTGKGENLIRIFVVHDDKDLWVAVLHDLLSLPEKAPLLDVEGFIFLIDSLLKSLELLASD